MTRSRATTSVQRAWPHSGRHGTTRTRRTTPSTVSGIVRTSAGRTASGSVIVLSASGRRRRGARRGSIARRAWAAEHPEERQQARERYKQKHPEAYKQAQRDYYYRNRDAIAERRRAREAADPEKANEARRRAVDRARAAGRDPAWSPTPDQRATYRERENEARRLQRRRARAGLPERRLHRVLAAERRHNAAAADAFFARKRSREEIARIREQDVPTPPELVHALAAAFGDPSRGA